MRFAKSPDLDASRLGIELMLGSGHYAPLEAFLPTLAERQRRRRVFATCGNERNTTPFGSKQAGFWPEFGKLSRCV